MRATALLCTLVSAPGAAIQQPTILLNPDTVITTAPEGGLDALVEAAEEAVELDGGHFGIAVKDFATGETAVRTEGGTFDIGSPDLIICSCAISLDESGECSLDTLSGRDLTVGDHIMMAREGNLEVLNMITGRVRPARIATWLAEKGFTSTTFSGVQLYWPGAPEVDPNVSTPGDCMGMLSVIQGRLDEAEIRRLVRNPFTRTGLEDLQSGGTPIYGFSSRGQDGGRLRAAVIALPDGHMYGSVVLADSLCCEEKADLAFRMVWEALK